MEFIMTEPTNPPHNKYDLSGFKAKLAEKPRRGRKEKYPWRTMKNLDTFFISSEVSQVSSVRSMASAKGKDLDRGFSVTLGAGGCWVTREW